MTNSKVSHISPLTHAEGKLIRSLARRKNRDDLSLFLAEGPKTVAELLRYFSCRLLVVKKELAEDYINMECLRVATEAELSRYSLQKAPQGVMGVFEKPAPTTCPDDYSLPLSLALDGIQDPGNLGTILRTADWMGIRTVFASPDTVDCFSPKVVQSTMGALGRVRVIYTDLPPLLEHLAASGTAVCGTFMQGENLYEADIPAPTLIVMGNEGNGIRPEVEEVCTRRLTIPRYVPESESSESLNVAIATAIVLAEMKRRTME